MNFSDYIKQSGTLGTWIPTQVIGGVTVPGYYLVTWTVVPAGEIGMVFNDPLSGVPATTFDSQDGQQILDAVADFLPTLEAVINVKFVQVPFGGAVDLTLVNATNISAPSYDFRGGISGGPDGYNAGLVVLKHFEDLSLSEGSIDKYKLIHELGHALGLKHLHDAGESGGPIFPGLSDEEDPGAFGLNDVAYTAMSYNDTDGVFPNTFMAADVAALISKYGSSLQSDSHDVYVISDAVGYNLIVDGGSTRDKIVNNLLLDAAIDLRSATDLVEEGGGGYLSSFVTSNPGGSWGYLIAAGTVIEDADGNGAKDTIVGNQVGNVLQGFGGDDVIRGLGGSDTLRGGAGSDQVYGDEGSDHIHLDDGISGDMDYVNGGVDTDTLWMHAAATYRLDATSTLPIKSSLGLITSPGSGIGISSLLGAAYVQAVENLVAADGQNDIWISNFTELNATGLKFLDFTAGEADVVNYTGLANASLYVRGELGQSIIRDGANTSAKVAGVETWNLTGATDTVTIYATHVGTQQVAIYGAGGSDTAIFSNFTGDLEFKDGEEVGNSGVVLHGFNTLVGGSGNDTFYGTYGRDVVYGEGGITTVYGSLGNDFVSTKGALVLDYSASASAVHFYRNGPLYQGGGAVTSMSYGDQFGIQAGAKITIFGSEHQDGLSLGVHWGELNGGGGNDTLSGGGGDDRLIGGADDEVMGPGDGSDYIDFQTGGGTLHFGSTTIAGVINLATRSFVFGSKVDTVVGSFEKLVGTTKGDTIDGTEQRDVIDGGGGYDIIYGLGGNDDITLSDGIVHAGSGEDTIKVTGKNVLAFGGDDKDTFSTATNSGWVAGSMLYGEGGDDVFNVEDLYGRTIQGLTLIGGAGADEFNGGQYAASVISYNSSASGVTLIRAMSGLVEGVGGDSQGDVLSGWFSIQGSEHGDHFELAWGSDGYVHGGGGADFISGWGTIYGDSGADTITSSSGSHNIYLGVDTDIDTFVFSRLAGTDKIYDFTSIDVIEIGAGYKYDDFGDILANASQAGSNINIVFESNMKLTIMGYDLSSLTAGNFDFT